MGNFRLDQDTALHQMGTAILQVIQGIGVLRIEFQGHLEEVERIVVFLPFQQAHAHVIDRLRLHLGIGRGLQHLLEGLHRSVMVLLLVQGIAQVELGIDIGGLSIERLPVIRLGFGVVSPTVLTVSLPNELVHRLGLGGDHRKQAYEHQELFHCVTSFRSKRFHLLSHPRRPDDMKMPSRRKRMAAPTNHWYWSS